MRDIVPYVIPSNILKYFNLHPLNSLDQKKLRAGKSVPVIYPTLMDYFGTIPEKFRINPDYSNRYHNALLRMMQLLVNEGLLTPEGNANGFDQRYRGNGYDENLARYGHYDFMIMGFPVIRKNFENAVRPVIVNRGVKDKKEDIGTGFTVGFGKSLYFVTARHCLPKGDLITIPMYVPHKMNPYFPSTSLPPKIKILTWLLLKLQISS